MMRSTKMDLEGWFVMIFVASTVILWGNWGDAAFIVSSALILLVMLAVHKLPSRSFFQRHKYYFLAPLTLAWLGGAAIAAWILWPGWAVVYLGSFIVAVWLSSQGESSHNQPEV